MTTSNQSPPNFCPSLLRIVCWRTILQKRSDETPRNRTLSLRRSEPQDRFRIEQDAYEIDERFAAIESEEKSTLPGFFAVAVKEVVQNRRAANDVLLDILSRSSPTIVSNYCEWLEKEPHNGGNVIYRGRWTDCSNAVSKSIYFVVSPTKSTDAEQCRERGGT